MSSALQSTLVIAGYCKNLYIINRGMRFRAFSQLIDAIKVRENIKQVWDTVVEEIIGGQNVKKVRVRNLTDNVTMEIPCKGCFCYIGLDPNCNFVPIEIMRDEKGYLTTDMRLQTAMKSVYAAGAVRANYGGMLTVAIDEAKTVAIEAIAYARNF